MPNFIVTNPLPAVNGSRALIYTLAETLAPSAGLIGPGPQAAAQPLKAIVGAGLQVTTGPNPQLDVAPGVPYWIKVILPYGAWAAPSTTTDIEVYSLLPSQVLHATAYAHTVSFAGAGITAFTMSLGIEGSVTKYGAARDVFAAVNALPTFQNTLDIENLTGPTSVRGFATATGANLNAGTAGMITFWLLVSNLP